MSMHAYERHGASVVFWLTDEDEPNDFVLWRNIVFWCMCCIVCVFPVRVTCHQVNPHNVLRLPAVQCVWKDMDAIDSSVGIGEVR